MARTSKAKDAATGEPKASAGPVVVIDEADILDITLTTEPRPDPRAVRPHVVRLTDRVNPSRLQKTVGLGDLGTFTFTREAPVLTTDEARETWEKAAKRRPAVVPVGEHTLLLTDLQADQLRREFWDVTLVNDATEKG